MALVAESPLFGQRVMQRRRREKRTDGGNNDAVIKNLTELREGAPVVHIDHGVGRYLGLATLEVENQVAEFLMLAYAEDAKLPATPAATTKWRRCIAWARKPGRRPSARRPNRSATWRPNCSTSMRAGPLAKAMRLPTRKPITPPSALASRSKKPPISRHGGRQVAILVPTTLLAQQHYNSFRDRFADWPVTVEVMSRFKSAKEVSAAVADLAEGKIDIVIGTHKLLQDDVKIKNLGLVIIDEEHRFGVRQKEQLKALRSEVDILSIIATPPARRLSVRTFVMEQNKPTIKEALLRELLRGGQVYYLHNDVKTIEKCAADLAELVPEARIGIGHGQMRERDLEQVMSDFYHKRFNVLIASTIIETGIDVPSANTIITERADKFGLAQLHQLRGRVGRSHHQAYAYLLTPPRKQITPPTRKSVWKRLPTPRTSARASCLPPMTWKSVARANCLAMARAARFRPSVSRCTWKCSNVPSRRSARVNSRTSISHWAAGRKSTCAYRH